MGWSYYYSPFLKWAGGSGSTPQLVSSLELSLLTRKLALALSIMAMLNFWLVPCSGGNETYFTYVYIVCMFSCGREVNALAKK